MERMLVVGEGSYSRSVPEHIDVIEGSTTDLVHEEGTAEVWLFGEDTGTHLGVMHSPYPLGQREVGQFVAVGGPVLKGIELRLVAQEYAEAAVTDLWSKVGPSGVGTMGRLEPGSPAARPRRAPSPGT